MWALSIIILYAVSVFFVILFSMGQLALLITYMRNRRKINSPTELSTYPEVAIQLPVYNEGRIIEGLLDAIALINYPKDKLLIQILDDSTDETIELCAARARQLKAQGFNAMHLQRGDRRGFKAGALQEGLEKCSSEFITIFDADFLPQPDFLLKVLPYFSDPKTGLVQTRWGHKNAGQSWLTRVQELGLNGHFIIDQQARHQAGWFINFNGTAGIWRKSCIVDAGGWQFDTLTEDLDLSYRAQMRGWKLCYCPEVITPAELPARLQAMRSQQFRWIKGGIETSKKIILDLWSCPASLPAKIFGSFHLLSNYVYLFILLSSILSVPAMIIKNLDPAFGLFFRINSLFFSVFFINLGYCYVTVRADKNKVGPSVLELTKVFPMAVLVSLGMSYNNSTAIMQGIRGKKTAFIRTPKLIMPSSLTLEAVPAEKVKRQEWPEIILFVYFFFAVVVGVYFRDFSFLPYHFIMLSGFGLILYYAYQQP